MTWVYKEDGTRQCGQGEEIPLGKMEEELARIIGSDNISSSEKRVLPFVYPAVCGGQTGSVNAYEISDEGCDLLFHGYLGKNGFQLWLWSDNKKSRKGPNVPFPLAKSIKNANDDESAAAVIQGLVDLLQSSATHPTLISELTGLKCRYYKSGAPLNLDLRPNRANIHVNDEDEIIRVWFG